MASQTRWFRAAKLVKVALLSAGVAVVLFQLVPYGREHSNPPVVVEPSWDQPGTRELAVTACFDCHSNETKWPWYSHVAPISWLVQRDVDEGRRLLNFSEWNRPYEEASESAEAVLEGEMPLPLYVLPHPSARLSMQDKLALARGLSATLGPADGEHSYEDDD